LDSRKVQLKVVGWEMGLEGLKELNLALELGK